MPLELPARYFVICTDQDIQYTCKDYTKILKDNGIRISMSGKGNPYDNAFAELFFKTLKQEEVYLWRYKTFSDVIEKNSLLYRRCV